MADIILVVAVAGDKRSNPIKVYNTGDVKLPKQFVMRVDDAGESDSGIEQLKLSNFTLKLIATHGSEYLSDKLEGFRRSKDGSTFAIFERLKDDTPTVKAIADVEVF